MERKILSILGIVLLLVTFQSCSSKPEEGLLQRYFHAISLKDNMTLSNMAMEPIEMDVESWEIVSGTEEVVEPVKLPEMDKKEKELQKELEENVGPVLDAKDELLDAEYELEHARTSSAKRNFKKKVEELEEKYREIRDKHDQLQIDYNEAKAAAEREEEITLFSLGVGEIPNARDLTGDLHFKEVVVLIKEDSVEKKYNFVLRKYVLKDETLNLTRHGRWIIVRIEPID